MRRDLYEPDHEAFREVVQAYVKREVAPNQQRWEQEHIVDRAPAENSSMLVGAVVRAEPTLYAIAVGGTLM
jgi:hypothetical protein